MDIIRVGLDFGTHQTKICVRKIQDEGHGESFFEFFTFKDLADKKKYFLPSIVQINKDDTLSYGYVDKNLEKLESQEPTINYGTITNIDEDITGTAHKLFQKYATEKDSEEDLAVISDMLNLRNDILSQKKEQETKAAEARYESEMEEYRNNRNYFLYFKQATFAIREWHKKIDSDVLCIWYLTYIIFLLEDEYGDNFSINMGVPADDKSYKEKKELAISILASAYNLVENVYDNDLNKYLSEKVDQLLAKTIIIPYSEDLKEYYNINVFPEAFANLLCFTSKGKLSRGMSLTADIGGGTTDMSFFTINNGKPDIYRYWSIPRGLNYLAEKSGFYYEEIVNINKQIKQEAIDTFNRKKKEIVALLVKDLTRQLQKETNISVFNLYNALENRYLIYSGGGSTLSILTEPINPFTSVKLIDKSLWNLENVKNKSTVDRLCQLLMTAYGLTLGDDDAIVKLSKFTSLFQGLPNNEREARRMVDKDCC